MRKFSSIVAMMLCLVMMASTVTSFADTKYVNAKTNTDKIPVMTYHNVVTDSKKKTKEYKNSTLAVSKSTFNKQMKYLKKHGYRTINCEEMYLWHKGELKLPKKTVMITFDDGASGVTKNALPVLKKYHLKATVFIVGKRTYNNKSGSIRLSKMRQVQEQYPSMEFQSHTYALHKNVSSKGVYEVALKDATKQAELFPEFEYIAYPYGRSTSDMRRAYRDAGLKMGFKYGKNNYATRKQDIFQISRIKVDATKSFSSFTKWLRK